MRNLNAEFQILDKDLVKSNDFLSSKVVDLRPLFEKVLLSGRRQKLTTEQGFSGGSILSGNGDIGKFTMKTEPNSGASDTYTSSKLKVTIDLLTQKE